MGTPDKLPMHTECSRTLHVCDVTDLGFTEHSVADKVSDMWRVSLLHDHHHASLALPSFLRVFSRLAISMAVTAASPPLFPALPPALSIACRCKFSTVDVSQQKQMYVLIDCVPLCHIDSKPDGKRARDHHKCMFTATLIAVHSYIALWQTILYNDI